MKIGAKVPPRYESGPDVTPVVGEYFNGEGIFMGTYELTDWQSRGLGKMFNVFAAPRDLTNEDGEEAEFQYEDALTRIGELGNWHGHEGGKYRSEAELDDAMDDGRYNGEWVLPNHHLMCDPERDDTMSKLHDKGDFAGTFETTAPDRSPFHPRWYWSFTKAAEGRTYMNAARIADGQRGMIDKKLFLRCRLVRFVPVKP